ncbi:hypothetical protein [Pseudomonas sp. NMS19W]|uniref:hypothetical protein n=1 Tax=Pseudomonas sp. NMS19W TaxID=3079768 RepID=UPI003F657E14
MSFSQSSFANVAVGTSIIVRDASRGSHTGTLKSVSETGITIDWVTYGKDKTFAYADILSVDLNLQGGVPEHALRADGTLKSKDKSQRD